MKHTLLLLTVICAALSSSSLEALKPKNFRSEEAATAYFHRHYRQGCHAFEHQHWYEAIFEFGNVVWAFPTTPCVAPSYFYLGISYFQLHDYDLANHAFSNYLKFASNPEFFEETLQYKFQIAEAFRNGCKRKLIRVRYCPQWFSARSLAISIYDEIVMTMPTHPLAVQSLFAKGCLLQSMGEYKSSTDEFQTLIRRFPKNELTPEAYLKISQNYYHQSCTEYHNPDLMALAEINAESFAQDFPKDERVVEAEKYAVIIKEYFAGGLVQMGKFYERICKPFSAALYYKSTVTQFPETKAAEFAQCRINVLGYNTAQIPDCSEGLHIKNLDENSDEELPDLTEL
jgi:outer membrane protein assembly factor BamD (BamD/ComL family)